MPAPLRLLAVSTPLLFVSSAWSDVIYSTFGTAGAFDHASFWGMAPSRSDAVTFQVSQPTSVSSFSLALRSGGNYTVAIRSSDQAGLPGAILAQFSTSGSDAKETFNFVNPLSLATGKYWVSAATTSTGGWYWNSIPTKGVFAYTSDAGPWTTTNDVLPVLQVEAVPEPMSIGALAVGMGALLRRRKARRALQRHRSS